MGCTYVTDYSVKGGTGKTTTMLGLAALLAERGRKTVVMDLQFLNPQHIALVGGEEPKEYCIDPKLFGSFKKESTFDITKYMTPSKNTKALKNMNLNDNLFFIFLNTRRKGYGVITQNLLENIFVSDHFASIGRGGLRHNFYGLLEETFSELLGLGFEYILIDNDASLFDIKKTQLPSFFRYLEGYTDEITRKEYARMNNLDPVKDKHLIDEGVMPILYGSPYSLTICERKFTVRDEEGRLEDRRFSKGISLFVSTPNVAEITGLKESDYFFEDFGPNHIYVLVINQGNKASLNNVKKELEKLPFKEYCFLPSIDMRFGQLGNEVERYRLPIYGDSKEEKSYRRNIENLIERVF